MKKDEKRACILPRFGYAIPMNISKLVLHNMTTPMEKRISNGEIRERVAIAKVRGTVLALAATIREEIRPQVEAMRKAVEL